ncbi:MAG: hypothetical protein ACFFD4_00510 [Candidatus Odinarchaeota archaeon]
MNSKVPVLVVASALILLSGCTQSVIDYGTATVIFAVSEEEGSAQLYSKEIPVPVKYSSTGMEQNDSRYMVDFDFPDEWSEIDYWLNITILFNDLVDHYITIEITNIGWIDSGMKYATGDKQIGHDAYRNGFPETAVIKAWKLGTGPGCLYGWSDTGC